MKQVYNPYLPLDEYIPDGEPHVFGDRVYIYGSHDYAGGDKYCMGHYMGWSAPLNDLRDWTCHGVIYERTQDPTNAEDIYQLWAPDVCQGVDGRYYLYYCFSFVEEIGVAVSDSPQGPFEFYGHVKYPKHLKGGKKLTEYLPFDPAVLVDDDKKVYLYYGFSPKGFLLTEETLRSQGKTQEEIDAIMNKVRQMPKSPGAMVVELETDMLTIKGEPELLIPGGDVSEGTPYEGHAFFEASSMRKVNDTYYFVYSSELSHELCYATSKYPNREFSYGGPIVSNGDLGYQGNTWPQNMIGNNHGGMVEINGEWYIFYHRQTHGTEFSRQGCAEKISIAKDGSIAQVERTSCGLNQGPLKATGKYPAAIASTLTCKNNYTKLVLNGPEADGLPYIFEEETQEGKIHYIANIIDSVTIGYKYFDYAKVKELVLTVKGCAKGSLELSQNRDADMLLSKAKFAVSASDWVEVVIPVTAQDGEYALFLHFEGEGSFALKEFAFR